MTLSSLEKSLRRRFRVVETTVEVCGRALTVLHPESAEELIDEGDFERDERLPYWAELWPSSRVLAEQLVGMAGGDRTLLELGCGAGLVATCAALADFAVMATDYYEDAIAFARVNAWRNGARPIGGVSFDWRQPASLGRAFDVVVASDVLYERPYGALVAGAIGATLSADGQAFVADPGRVARDDFVGALPAHGLEVRRRADLPFSEGAIRQTISVFEIARRQR